jgi:hypothetical protein
MNNPGSNTFKYYRYEGYSYRIEHNPDGVPVGCSSLELDGSWLPVTFGWQVILDNNTPITEGQAFLLAGVKRNEI